MPKTKEPVYSNLELLSALFDPTYKPKPMTARELEILEDVRKFRELAEIRRGYKGEWNAGAKYFYLELIRAVGLDDEWKESLMELARPTPGRKHSVEKAVRIALLKRQGLTAKQIAKQLECEGNRISVEGVESYLKRRRKPSVVETVRAAMKSPSLDVGNRRGDCSR
jgi:DNA-binding CsgD family transcriptional regulator